MIVYGYYYAKYGFYRDIYIHGFYFVYVFLVYVLLLYCFYGCLWFNRDNIGMI